MMAEEITVFDVVESWDDLDMELITEESMEETREVVADLQAAQMYAGVDVDNDPIQPGYAPRTIMYKIDKGQPTDRVTLRDTGDFYKGITTTPVGKGEMDIDSIDPKTEALVKKYGAEIFGLNPDNADEYLEQHLRPVFVDKVQAITGLQFDA